MRAHEASSRLAKARASADAGGHHADNLLTVCGAHHRALHRGELAVEGDAASSSFRHGDGSFYGGVANPKNVDLMSKLFSALRGLGFREAEVRAVLGELRGREQLQGAPIQTGCARRCNG